MKAVRLYRHPECERCAGYARMHHRFDWLGRFEDTTQTPPTGQLLVGEIAVQDLRTGATLKGDRLLPFALQEYSSVLARAAIHLLPASSPKD